MKNCDKGESISESFSFANPELLKMLESMLEFNPYFRLTAEEALKSKVFDGIRIQAFERPSPVQIKLNIFAEDAYDYENHTDHKLSKHDLNKALAREVISIKKISPFYIHP